MTLSYYDGKLKTESKLASWLMVINFCGALAFLGLWAALSMVIEEPLRWATRHAISPNPPVMEYPYLMLWLMPLSSACTGWLAIKAEAPALARFAGVYPILLLSLMLGWYYLTPAYWH